MPSAKQQFSTSMDFSELGLEPNTLKAVIEAGYITPTPIQERAIPLVLMGRDVLGIAQTGTGKTASFSLPMIDILATGRSKARMPRSLILCPTRELATQVAESFEKYGKYAQLSLALLIGGESFTDQEKKLERGVDVLVATPGRLLDLFERGKVLLNDVKVLVIDEADRMLDMGFIPDVQRIVSLIPRVRQTLFFSATMHKEIKTLADQFLLNPKEVAVDPPATAADTVVQGLITVPTDKKSEALRRLLRRDSVNNAFIFCNRKKDVDIVHQSLANAGFNAVLLHGDMIQSKRFEMLEKFKSGAAEILVCSDVAARGLDIVDATHVINFDVPVNAEDYIHRIGRTGRAGRTGHAYTIATPGDYKLIKAIEILLGRSIPRPHIATIDNLSIPATQSEQKPDQKAQKRPTAMRQSKSTDKKANNSSVTKNNNTRKRQKTRAKGKISAKQQDIQDMEHGDDVIAFGAYTPSFLKGDDPKKKNEGGV